MESFEDIGAVMTSHVTYWKFSSGVIGGPAAQIVNSAVDNHPIIPFTVVLFHLIEAVVLRFLHSEEERRKPCQNPQETSNEAFQAEIFTTANRWLYNPTMGEHAR